MECKVLLTDQSKFYDLIITELLSFERFLVLYKASVLLTKNEVGIISLD